MHPDIRSFWEKQGKVIVELTEPQGGYTNVPMYLIEENGIKKRIIAAPFDKKMTYYIDKCFYFEEDALRRIKLSAFF